ncbi:HalOD1 output domain-containing protein [Halovivax cerinus]|uniref:HalOD1 output domain-containing protein n=1 Tax=Halovivax cerinus TaxID=1487865 RepID=A0ABD5NJ52_9EURY|nr:HalOD1 output domain-containing protein [Halovivax cerinus]
MANRNDSSPTDGAESMPDADPAERDGFASGADPTDRRRRDPDGSSTATVTITRERGETPAHSVVRGVSAVTNTDPATLQPLYDTIDPDALNRLFERRTGADGGSAGTISFRFNGCDVTISADGRTTVSRVN